MTAVLVMGGASGIGAAVVRGFRQKGADVILVDIDRPAGAALCAEAGPGTARFIECDLGTAEGVTGAVDAALASTGGVLDVVFYNAGRLDARPLADWTVDLWDRTMALNLRSPFLVAQRTADVLGKSAHGRIIVTSSTGAFRSHAGMGAYHASKAGLLGLVRALADELGPRGITVNAVCPGWIDTPFNDGFWQHQPQPDAARERLESGIPLRRQGTPDDVVSAVLFLASPESGYITGQSVVVDGGFTAV